MRRPAASNSFQRSAWWRAACRFGQGEPERFAQAVHAVGREHPRAGPQVGQAERSRSSSSVSLTELSPAAIIESIRSSLRPSRSCVAHRRASLHRPARDEDGRKVEPHGGHEHAGRDLVAVADAHQRIGNVRLDHVLDAVGDQVSAG